MDATKTDPTPHPRTLFFLCFFLEKGKENHQKSRDFLSLPNPQNPWQRREKRSKRKQGIPRKGKNKEQTKKRKGRTEYLVVSATLLRDAIALIFQEPFVPEGHKRHSKIWKIQTGALKRGLKPRFSEKIATRNRKSLATVHRTGSPKSQCKVSERSNGKV